MDVVDTVHRCASPFLPIWTRTYEVIQHQRDSRELWQYNLWGIGFSLSIRRKALPARKREQGVNDSLGETATA